MSRDYTIREATVDDAAGIARVHIDSWRTTYKGIVPDNYLAQMDYQERSERWSQRLSPHSPSGSLTLVATNAENEVIGFVSGGKEREGNTPHEGEIYALYLLSEYREQGIGSTLSRELATRLQEEGYSSMLVWVLSLNPNYLFYEHIGGSEARRKTMEIGGKEFEEIAYRWENISTLCT